MKPNTLRGGSCKHGNPWLFLLRLPVSLHRKTVLLPLPRFVRFPTSQHLSEGQRWETQKHWRAFGMTLRGIRVAPKAVEGRPWESYYLMYLVSN